MRQRTGALLTIIATAMVGIVWALEDMTVVTVRTLGTKPKSRKGATNTGSREGIDMGIAACTVRAVAAKEMGACGHAVVSQIVRKIAIATGCARAVAKEVFANRNLGRIVGESASRSKGTIT